MESNFVIHGDICYSEGPGALRTVEDGYLVCQNGRSAGVYKTLPRQYAALPIRDYGGAMVLPGLCDLHVHAPQFPFRSMGMDLELLDWLNTHTFPEEAKFQSLEYAEKAYSLFVQDVRRGPNTRACVFATLHLPATRLLMDKLEHSGLVTLVGKVNMDRNSHPNLQEQDAQSSLRDTRAWLKEMGDSYQNTRPILTPRFIPACSDELMEGLAALQRDTGLPLQSHLSENPGEVAWVRQLCPTAQGYADAYDSFGLFGTNGPTVMAHCVWVTPHEIELMRRRQVYVAHCPQSNLNLSSGIAPARLFLQQQVPMGLGSDMAGGCHTSIFRAMADAIQASKMYWRLVDQTAPALSVAEAFYLGTLGGGSFFGKVGSFAKDYELDAIIVEDADIPATEKPGMEERLARVIYLSDERQLKAKYVRGVQLF